MKRGILFFIIVVACAGRAVAYTGEYAASNIPPALLKNADAVLRMEELRFEIIDIKETIETHHYVITILNENGNRRSEFYESYDKLQDIISIQGNLYDAGGTLLRTTRSKDIEDISGVDDETLMNDNRIKHHNFYYKTYPYTVEYSVVIRYHHSFFFPGWVPQDGERISVEKSYMTVVCPENYHFRYKTFNYPDEPFVVKDNKKKSSTWTVNQLAAILKEPYQPPLQEITPVILFAPTEFQLGDYHGNMQSWQDFGKFIYALKDGRDALPPDVKSTVHELTNNITDERKKIEILYEYLQKNTRYISIQLGIGGFQPFDARFVASKNYGDCKALTNYMYSLLKEAGIKSCYTVVLAGVNANNITEDFPSQQFNHVILCVPLKTDTVWLECTSQTMPAGYMGGFTGNRSALLVDENGGMLVHTPRYGVKENTQVRRTHAVLTEDASLQIKAKSTYMAMKQDELNALINGLSKDRLKDYLRDQYDLGTYEINNFDYTQNKYPLPSVDESLDITVSNYATITGKRIFIVPNIMTRIPTRLLADTARKYPLEAFYEYRNIDSVEIEIPNGYVAEAIPSDVSLETRFGKFYCSVQLKDNKLYYVRSMERYSGRFPAIYYNELVKYFETIYKSDRNKVVLVKRE